MNMEYEVNKCHEYFLYILTLIWINKNKLILINNLKKKQ